MSSGGGNAFIKARTGPSVLPKHTSGELPFEGTKGTSQLLACDFCAIELHFLAARPPAQVTCQPARLPLHLRRLAEGLLGTQKRATPYRLSIERQAVNPGRFAVCKD
jgi:hypothetical protein